ncbi:MAG: mechanosensitive ion channel, partial [Clostridium sp.]
MDFKKLINKFLIENGEAIAVLYIIIKIILIFILAKIATKVVKRLIDKFFNNQQKLGIQVSEQKKKTLTELGKNITMYVVYFIAIVWTLETMGIQKSTILAVAGAASVAIGLGAQSIIKDVISGF